jgi:hypothetical protein
MNYFPEIRLVPPKITLLPIYFDFSSYLTYLISAYERPPTTKIIIIGFFSSSSWFFDPSFLKENIFF